MRPESTPEAVPAAAPIGPAGPAFFALPPALARKADPALIAVDDAHLAAIRDRLAAEIAGIEDRLVRLRATRARAGQEALDRDLEIHRSTSRLQLLRRFGVDLCLGRMVAAGADEPVYIGRIGLTDSTGRRLLVDWRAPAAEPFFAATHGDPQGLVSRRRYRWASRRITDYWDEVFDPEGLDGAAALDDQSAFIASLGASRSPRMRDVLSTIQADQDAIIRASSRGPLVVDGGPGTGKTVVALHRAAYLMHAEQRLSQGGILFVGPHRPYLAYVEDVLPSLGEDSVRVCTLADLAPEGRDGDRMPEEQDPLARRLKSGLRLLDAAAAAVRYHEHAPEQRLRVETPWRDVVVEPAAWTEAFDAPEPGTPHNDARDVVWDALIGSLVEDDADDDVPPHLLDRALRQSAVLQRAFVEAWPVLDPAGVVADLWSIPAYLRICAPWLSEAERAVLRRDDPRAWTRQDLPFLDVVRALTGDPAGARRRRRQEAVTAEERDYRERVLDELLAADDDKESAITGFFFGDDSAGVREMLLDEAALPRLDPDAFAGPFAHVIVDEAQELSDSDWAMLLRRVPSRSLTIVGDRAQARHGFGESWEERLERIGLRRIQQASLRINYRTPEEVMAAAEPVIRAALPDANVPVSVRASGIPVRHARIADRDAILADWLAAHDEGIACVIGDERPFGHPRVRLLTPVTAKGLEYDLVVLVDPEAFGEGIEGAVDRYVSMTRATQELVVLDSGR
ncbi:RNA polymerase recycling motor ATPase HelR [Microbacterium capsulatum]|uniref:RNA polymerase recycling motor ATPase HelR n=1 Tax=Microbacterium capsulatum TaxID=3041921 RepID=A0ABU0XGB3_9MICO|nr:RNA polymerase recycling motor ATPase HelR [Microbacterium sp. ASV81]MDQ4214164.1 RNA polymerase recycling motor ATPase HelR [Microbacterium sp. ASV81]